MLIHVATGGGRDVISKEAKTIAKYEYLTLEIRRIWSVKQNYTSNSRGKRSRVNIPKIDEQQTGKVQSQ
jgi:hypothetical protein